MDKLLFRFNGGKHGSHQRLKLLQNCCYCYVRYYQLNNRLYSNDQAMDAMDTNQIMNEHYNSTTPYITFNPNGSYKMYKFDQLHNKIDIDISMHDKYMKMTPIDILQSLLYWSLLSNKRNISNFDISKTNQDIMQYLNDIGFIQHCPPKLLTTYYQNNFIQYLDEKLSSNAYSKHQHLNFMVMRSLQIFDFLHWRLLNNNTAEHVSGARAMRQSKHKYKSQLQVNPDKILFKQDALKTLRYLRINSLYLALYDIALHEIQSVTLSYSVLKSWIEHGFHLFVACNPGHFSLNHSLNPLHEMYTNAFYHILSEKPKYIDAAINKEYKKNTQDSSIYYNDRHGNKTFVFTMLSHHIMEYFGVGNLSSILKKVLLRCIIFDRQKYRMNENNLDLNKELNIFQYKKFTNAFSDIFYVYGTYWNESIKDRLYNIIMRYFASVGEIDAIQYVYKQAKKKNNFGVLDAYNMIKLCEALNTYIINGLFISESGDNNITFMYHSDPLSGYNEPNKYFIIRTQQCIYLLSKILNDRDQMLLSMAFNNPNESGFNINEYPKKVYQMTDSDRMKLEKFTANCGLDITTMTHRILYCLTQLQVAIQQYQIATNTKLKFNYPEKLLNSLLIIERIHHKYPLSNDWQYLKLSEQKQMFLDIANGIRSGVLLTNMAKQHNDLDGIKFNPPTKILKLRLLNHYGSLWHLVPFTDVLSSCMAISDLTFNTFLQSLNINILPHSQYKLATFFRVCSLYFENYSLKNQLTKNDVLNLCAKLVNILQYAVGDDKSTSYNYFLLNVKLLILSIKDSYNHYIKQERPSNCDELRCIFTQNIYTMMIDNELIKQNKHFIPDLELSEMILHEWFKYFITQYKLKNNHSNTFKELFIHNNLFNDLLEYSISMKVFDDHTSHPLIFHLSILSKLITLTQFDHNQQFKNIKLKSELINLWNQMQRKENKDNYNDFIAPIENCMNKIVDIFQKQDYIENLSILDDIVDHVQKIWSPFYVEFGKNKRNERIDKQIARWKEMIEPQIMSILSPKDLRFLNNELTESSEIDIFEPLNMSQWFHKDKDKDKGQNDQEEQEQEEQEQHQPHQQNIATREKIPIKADQSKFEAFVNSLDVEYLKHLVSYQKFISNTMDAMIPSVDQYIANLNEKGVYVDPEMNSYHSFISSIEPLVQTFKKQKTMSFDQENFDNIEASEIQSFLDEAESIYDRLLIEQKKNKLITVGIKKQFLVQINNLLQDKPRLQLFLDGVQDVINENRYKLFGKRYSLIGDYKRFKQRTLANDELNLEFESWNEFTLNINQEKESRFMRNVMNKKQIKQHMKYLNESNVLIEDEDNQNAKRMIGDFKRNEVTKFLKSLESLPIKSNVSQETYALTKLVKEIDEMY